MIFFPDTHPYKYRYFSPNLCNRQNLNFFTEVCYSLSQNCWDTCHLHKEFALDNKESHTSVIAVIC